jgi:hypothetical protein
MTMKLTYAPGYCEESSFSSGEDAVAFQTELGATLCEGALEHAMARTVALASIVGRLMDELSPEAAARVLGPGWEGKQ